MRKVAYRLYVRLSGGHWVRVCSLHEDIIGLDDRRREAILQGNSLEEIEIDKQLATAHEELWLLKHSFKGKSLKGIGQLLSK